MYIPVVVLVLVAALALYGVLSLARLRFSFKKNAFLVGEIRPGDIVLYTDATNERLEERNLVTRVLTVMPLHGTAIIRSIKTTMVVRQSALQVLNLDQAFPLRVPECPAASVSFPSRFPEPVVFKVFREGEPLPEGARGVPSCNEANFSSVPLRWFNYGVHLDDEGKLCAC